MKAFLRKRKEGVSMNKGLYHLTYIKEDGETEVLEVPAYSTEQARFLSGIEEKDIVDVEEAVRKGAVEN